jgi:ATP-dependent helicase HrpB
VIPAQAVNLPIAAALDDLNAALLTGHALLQAPTGSGKSTQVPLALLDRNWLAGRRILMLEPRRPAARLTAARMADLLGEKLGETVGYQVRFERRIGPRTRIEVLTEGILTRRLQSDPALEGVGLVIFDELHELNLPSALGLALTLDVIANLRPDLRILAMSATLDAGPLAALLGGAPLIQAGGRPYPVEIHYAERDPGRDWLPALVATIRQVLADQSGDLLAFLPGAGEIERVRERLAGLTEAGIQILPLHGALPVAAQDLALGPGDGRRRLVLATDLAETSVTIPGIGVVVDSGLTRKPRFEPGSGLTRLVTEPIPRASADQRAGRAGRLGPGVCYRLWTRAQEAGRPEHRTPEILQADLAPLALELALWGVRDPAELQWLQAPPRPAWEQGVALLVRLMALDAAGHITQLGRAMAGLPVHPRLAALLTGAPPELAGEAADLCALLSERDPWLRRPGEPGSADLGARLLALQAFRDHRGSSDMEDRRLVAIDRAAAQLRRLLKASEGHEPRAITSSGSLLALAYPDRVAQRRGEREGRYLLAQGSGAVLPPGDPLASHPYLVAAGLDAAGRDGRIQLALPITEAEIQALFADRIQHERLLTWDPGREAASAQEVRRLGAITLAARPVALLAADPITDLLLTRLRRDTGQALNWSDAARQLQARVCLMRALEPDAGWPDLTPAHLEESLETWLGPWLAGKSRLDEVHALDLAALLAAQLDWEQRQRLDQEAPASLLTPAGTRHPIDYLAGAIPILAVPLQEMLGTRATPSIAQGRVPLLIQLLSPARRPIQLTRDLPGFWAGSYAQVRKEMRGRYPKHHWPEDPANAAPLARSIKARGV